MLSPAEQEALGEDAETVDSLAEGCSLALAAATGRAAGPASEAGKGSSGSRAGEGSDTGVLASSLSKGASGCTSPGEEDFWATGSNFGKSSKRRNGNGFRIQ